MNIFIPRSTVEFDMERDALPEQSYVPFVSPFYEYGQTGDLCCVVSQIDHNDKWTAGIKPCIATVGISTNGISFLTHSVPSYVINSIDAHRRAIDSLLEIDDRSNFSVLQGNESGDRDILDQVIEIYRAQSGKTIQVLLPLGLQDQYRSVVVKNTKAEVHVFQNSEEFEISTFK